MAVNDFDLQLKELVERSTDRLLCADVFDHLAFEELYDCIVAKTPALRETHVVSKQILTAIRGAQSAIESRAEYLPDVRQNIDLARRFAMLLDMIVAGEIPIDRDAERPRII